MKKHSKKLSTILGGIALLVIVVAAAVVIGYSLRTKEKPATEAASGTVWPNGGSQAYNQGQFIGLKVFGSKSRDFGDCMVFGIENRLALNTDEWSNNLKGNFKKRHPAWIDLPLEVWDGSKWVDVIEKLMGKAPTEETAKKLAGTNLIVYSTKPGFAWYDGMDRDYTFYQTSSSKLSAGTPSRWCLRFNINGDNYNKLQERRSELLSVSLLSQVKLNNGLRMGKDMCEFRTFFYHHDRTFRVRIDHNNSKKEVVGISDKEREGLEKGTVFGQLEKIKAAGKAGLRAPTSFSGSYNPNSSRVTLKWDKMSGLNVHKYHLVNRLAGNRNWEHVATINYPSEQYSYFARGSEGKTFEYQIQALSYFDQSVRAYSPIVTVKIGTGSNQSTR